MEHDGLNLILQRVYQSPRGAVHVNSVQFRQNMQCKLCITFIFRIDVNGQTFCKPSMIKVALPQFF